MKLAVVSDTHGRHAKITVPPCDLLVHAGDWSHRGTRDESLALFDWLAAQPAEAVVLVAGNHDLWAEAAPDQTREAARERGLRYLCDEGCTVGGLTIWGSPVTPTFKRMAFNRDRGEPIRTHWDAIPAGLDLLITHGPPRGVADRMFLGLHVGCDDLLEAVQARPPRVHLFGHIHEAAGEARLPGCPTRFINAASRRLLFGVREAVCLELTPHA